jgi:hypothetical protein
MDSKDLSVSLLESQKTSNDNLHHILGQTSNPLISVNSDSAAGEDIIKDFSNKVHDSSAQVEYTQSVWK